MMLETLIMYYVIITVIIYIDLIIWYCL